MRGKPVKTLFSDAARTEQNFVDLKAAADVSELWEGLIVLFPVQLCAIYLVRVSHIVGSCNLIKEHKFSFGELVQGAVGLLMDDPIYSICRNRADKNSGEDQFTTDDVKAMMSICRKNLNRNFRDHIFWSTLQF